MRSMRRALWFVLPAFAALVLAACGGGGGGGDGGSDATGGGNTGNPPPPPTAQALSLLAGNAAGPGSLDGSGAATGFDSPRGLAADSAGNVFIADAGNHTIRKMTPTGVVSTVAGSPGLVGSADGPAATARFASPSGVAVAGDGTLYVTDAGNATVRKISVSGTVSTLAGSAGQRGHVDATGTAARFDLPSGIAVDAAGTVYVTELEKHTLRRISAAGVVDTLAGTADAFGTTDGSGAAARFNAPSGIAVDTVNGDLLVADSGNHAIRRVTSAGSVSTVAGSALGFADGNGTAANFSQPFDIALDAAGAAFVVDSQNNNVRKLTTAGDVSTVAGQWDALGSADGDGAAARFLFPSGIAVDRRNGIVYVADTSNHTLRKIDTGARVTTIAGAAPVAGQADGAGAAARFNAPNALAIDAAGTLYVADTLNNRVRTLQADGTVSLLADGADNPLQLIDLPNPLDGDGITVDASGNVFVAVHDNTVRKITPAGVVSLVVGLPNDPGSDDGNAAQARFNAPYGIAACPDGSLAVADNGNSTLRKISFAAGVPSVSTLAGLAGSKGHTDGTGSAARFDTPAAIACDKDGFVYVTDQAVDVIRKVSPQGVVSTLAGTAGVKGSADGSGASASFDAPRGIATDAVGNVYVADTGNSTVRKITPAGAVSTVVGAAHQRGFVAGDLPGVIADPKALVVRGNTLYIVVHNGVVAAKLPS